MIDFAKISQNDRKALCAAGLNMLTYPEALYVANSKGSRLHIHADGRVYPDGHMTVAEMIAVGVFLQNITP